MVKRIIQIGILTLCLSWGTTGFSQIKKEKQADKNFNRTAYINAIDTYERMVESGYVNASILQNLADAYYFNGKLEQANKWYTELFEGSYEGKNLSNLPSEYYYRYSQTLKAIKDYKKAEAMIDQFSILEKQDTRVERFNKDRLYVEHIENQLNKYDVRLLTINSAYSDYGGTVLDYQFVFTSARETEHQKKSKIHSWTNESYTSLYSAEIDQNGIGNPTRLIVGSETQVNDATAVFTSDGKTMFFTRNNSKLSGKSKQNKHHDSLLKLYKATKQSDGTWGQVEELPINSDNFNTAHPALTPDDKWLYFASDRKGILGQSDLYRVELYEDGGYGSIENLGKTVNTEGRESFPFISSDFQLYFASDGHPGLGGMDVFVSKLNPNGSFGPVVNMGEPINSSMDDFGFYWDAHKATGFVSSNRVEASGGDDIYLVSEKPCKRIIEGKVYDKNTRELVSNAKIIISDILHQKNDVVYTNDKGAYRISDLNCTMNYSLKAEKEAYNTFQTSLELNSDSAIQTFDIELEKLHKQVDINQGLSTNLRIEPIYFDFDKSNIRYDASIELKKIVEIMHKYPTMKIDIRSHTDSRGNDSYNLSLSNRRVKATINWMIKQGIEAGRLSGRGYGETQLLNSCSNVHCTEAEHQFNRRSEFIILEL
ncbi:OmpA family protein [Myroides odoratus]|uniref:OmpA family protein n=1 Tax=Myroides odoratus TaxID=256 RepID=A0A9Q6ZF14_MYROD|nr:OmpA family protein [Myroides odoratus]EHQ44222.1 OmpA/MotB domain protein [Myroides odoratus DSM 2801]EKB05839.1 hypothetical protein HMPREF9716_02677 [Myroides odoratus CIP 103059]QQU01506.1 OmpA family protein [Myroides odoratus]WQD56225.1 OmpA family protein [Myroides odoratus]STZ31540.1 Photosystem I P700 chlorophyll a apoprotein A2 [Myroides odoratus]